MNYYNEIKNKIIDNEAYCKVKDYSKERHTVITYFEIGKLLNDAGKHYGEGIIEKYSKKLVVEVGKKYNKRTLFRMKQFYNVFNNEKVSTLLTQLTWSHYLLLISLKDYDKIIYYINIASQKNLTQRELEERIKNKEYERLPEETKNKLITKNEVNIKDLVPNPIIIKNKNNIDITNEKILHNLILDNISSFMKELGNGYSFIDSEYKIKLGDNFNYIDLLLFNYEYNCFVVVELKITELKKEHIGQIQIYMNYIDKNVKNINHNNTIGIIVCKKDNNYIINYCINSGIIFREYQII